MNEVRAINYTNIACMILSAVLAVQLPYELFLFSYAVLGPLHYLTELNWLQKRNYFVKPDAKKWLKTLVVVMILVGLTASTTLLCYYLLPTIKITSLDIPEVVRMGLAQINNWYIYSIFAATGILVLFLRTDTTLVALLCAACAGVLLYIFKEQMFIVVFTLFLPTIIHVWFFTALFILAGALKAESFTAILSLLVFVICSVSFFIIDYDIYSYHPSGYVKTTFVQSNFNQLNFWIANFFTSTPSAEPLRLLSKKGLQIQSFIAFAYTYHYLNWFSKTSIIKWHETPKKHLIIVLTLWITSVSLYVFDYTLGLICLYFLSVLHVLAEFPLNWVVMRDVSIYLKKVLLPSKL